MPASGGKYKIVRKRRYQDAMGRIEDKQIRAEIAAAEEAIAGSPYSPDPPTPEKLYKLFPARETTGGTEPLHLMVALRKMQILANGYILKYTVRESGEEVLLEDLDRPLLYRLPEFQPRVK